MPIRFMKTTSRPSRSAPNVIANEFRYPASLALSDTVRAPRETPSAVPSNGLPIRNERLFVDCNGWTYKRVYYVDSETGKDCAPPHISEVPLSDSSVPDCDKERSASPARPTEADGGLQRFSENNHLTRSHFKWVEITRSVVKVEPGACSRTSPLSLNDTCSRTRSITASRRSKKEQYMMILAHNATVRNRTIKFADEKGGMLSQTVIYDRDGEMTAMPTDEDAMVTEIPEKDLSGQTESMKKGQTVDIENS